ncbi:MAG TPA: peptidoglycan-binding domain-containing protein, partial [Thermoleophilaceae bacterium]
MDPAGTAPPEAEHLQVRLRCVILAVPLGLAWAGPATAAKRMVIYPQVAGLQVALAAKRLYAGPVDALPGPMTSSAVRSLQRQHRLPV